jgi:hypothetical protein
MRILATPAPSVRPAKRPTCTRALATGAPVSPSKTITCTFERFGGGAGGGFSFAGAACVVVGADCLSEAQPAASSANANRTAGRRTRLRLETRAGGMLQ